MITALSISRGGLGRLGNTMFTIAGCIGIAVKSGQSYGFPEWLTKDNAIFGQPVDRINDCLLNPLPTIPEGVEFADYGYFWGYRDIYLPTGNWTIDAHMQSEKFFAHCINLVREIFTFKDEYPQSDYVAIHYRAGDYIDDENAHHPRCNREYYIKAMAQFPGEQFIVFSDDAREAYKIFGDEVLYPINETYIEDFKLMKSCKSFITSNSSFSLMAAILGTHPDKKIITPERWFGKGMPPEFDKKDIYPAEAVIL